jgi:methyl acetate hydrolase
MRKWFKQNPKKDMFAKDATVDDLVQPLDYEPGTNYTYSTSVDWAGFYVERRTGKTLEEYFQENIFKPVGATSMTFYPTEDIMSRLLKPCMMLPDGSYKVLPPRPLGKAATPDEVKLLLG